MAALSTVLSNAGIRVRLGGVDQFAGKAARDRPVLKKLVRAAVSGSSVISRLAPKVAFQTSPVRGVQGPTYAYGSGMLRSGEDQLGDTVQRASGYGERTFVHDCNLLL